MSTHKVTGHLIIKASRSDDNEKVIRSITSSRFVKNRPDLTADEVAVKLTIEVPDAVFNQFALAATITVPESAAIQPSVEAHDAGDGDNA